MGAFMTRSLEGPQAPVTPGYRPKTIILRDSHCTVLLPQSRRSTQSGTLRTAISYSRRGYQKRCCMAINKAVSAWAW